MISTRSSYLARAPSLDFREGNNGGPRWKTNERPIEHGNGLMLHGNFQLENFALSNADQREREMLCNPNVFHSVSTMADTYVTRHHLELTITN